MNFYKHIKKVILDRQDLRISLNFGAVMGRSTFSPGLKQSSGIALFVIPANTPLLQLGDWIVAGPKMPGMFMGVDRDLDRTRLAGVCMSIFQDIYTAVDLLNREGAKPDLIVGYDKNMRQPAVYLLQSDTWTLYVGQDGVPWQLTCSSPGYNGVVT